MTRKQAEQKVQALPKLRLQREQAFSRIQVQVDKGIAIRNVAINTREELKSARAEYYSWEEYAYELLQTLFTDDSKARQFRGSAFFARDFDNHPLQETIGWIKEDVDTHLRRLKSIQDRLDLFEVESSAIQQSNQSSSHHQTINREVFIVHGHDIEAKETVARFIEKLGLRSIILQEQPNSGRTIIEKFEAHADVEFAVVLLTPDDIGAAKDKKGELRSRARQNVIYELGYFSGKLGRGKVCALHKEDIEIPSDIQGVLFERMDPAGAWKLSLARELKAAGIDVDLNVAYQS